MAVEATISVLLVNPPPLQARAYEPRVKYVGNPVSINLGDPYWSSTGINTYTVDVLPDVLTMDSDGLVTGTPIGEDVVDSLVTATNEAGSVDAAATFNFTIATVPVVDPGDGAGLNMDLSLLI